MSCSVTFVHSVIISFTVKLLKHSHCLSPLALYLLSVDFRPDHGSAIARLVCDSMDYLFVDPIILFLYVLHWQYSVSYFYLFSFYILLILLLYLIISSSLSVFPLLSAQPTFQISVLKPLVFTLQSSLASVSLYCW